MIKTVNILGSTGSIGTSAIDIIKRNKNKFKVKVLTANNNLELLVKQATELEVEYICTAEILRYAELKERVKGTGIKVLGGEGGLNEAASIPADISLLSIVGAAGLIPAIKAIENSKRIALANKETLVCAGSLIMDLIKKHKKELIPVDSEHSAIFQSLEGAKVEDISKLILTASGGPFRKKSLSFIKSATPEDALKHPNWNMGAKITIDSATMMNKGLEIIEARWLFDIAESDIEVVVHPQSIIHSGVEFNDGGIIAQLGAADMRVPISYALNYPQRLQTGVKKIKLSEIGKLEFYPPDEKKFPSLRLAREALKIGGLAPCILNAANEIGVDSFLKRKCGFLEIFKTVEKTLAKMPIDEVQSIEQVIYTDRQARKTAKDILGITNGYI